VLRPYLLRRRYGEGVTGHLDDNLTKGLRAQNAARRPTNLGWYEQNVARDQQLCARPTWKSWCDQNLPQDEAALEAAKARAAQEGQAQELVTVTPEAIITVDQTDRKATVVSHGATGLISLNMATGARGASVRLSICPLSTRLR
jgi:hypothetical protein